MAVGCGFLAPFGRPEAPLWSRDEPHDTSELLFLFSSLVFFRTIDSDLL